MTEPKCPYFGRCGGCSAQHIDYALQLENKKKVMSDAVKCDLDTIKVFSGDAYGYRNRMDFVFHKGGLGCRKKGGWSEVVDVKTCVISNKKLNNLLSEVREYFKDCDYFDLKKQKGTFRYAVIRTPQEDSSISFVLNSDSSRLGDAVDKIKEYAKISSANNIIVTYVPYNSGASIGSDFFVVKGKDMLEESYGDKKFLYSVQGFFQNNHEMADEMISYVRDLLKTYDTNNAHLLDLYGGVGSFGIMCGDLFASTLIVESVKECIDAANKNIYQNDMMGVKAKVLDAKYTKRLDLQKPLYVITDPPRSGMHPDTISALNRMRPEVIIYVSCNLKQLGKDVPKFREYEVKSSAVFDLFPQTPHCEGVVELVRTKK